ncbi:hypothetical protein KM043_011710 [Ampulex compressa]|nr:hypothetical protein KM043_011710 [Ampulex compressa]
MKAPSILAALLGLLALGSATKCPKQRTSPGREIVCYTSTLDAEKLSESVCRCTTLVHQGHDVRNLSTSHFEGVQKALKEMHPPLQFVVSVDDPASVLRTSGNVRQETAARLIGILKEVDGVELNMTAGSKERLFHFVKGLKAEMVRKSYDKRLFMVLPTKPEDLAKRFDLKELSKYVDLFTVPTHYLVDDDEAYRTFHPSRLMGLFDMLNTDSLVDLISGLGAPKGKILVSVPASAYRFTLKDQDDNAPRSATTEKEPVVIDRMKLCQSMSNGTWTLERDEDLTAPYAFENKTWIAFEDQISIGIKGKYVLLRDLAGLAIRDLENDLKTKCGKPLTHEVHHSFTDFKRKSRQAVLNALEDDLRQAQISYTDQIKSSDFRVVRVVDTEGHIRAVRENTQTEFTCTRQGYFVHPKSCNRFYRCVKFNQEVESYSVFEFDCPAGLSFDESTEVCVWPGSMPEGSPCPGSSEIAPVNRVRFKCPAKPGYYADPQNCRWFFACIDLGGPELMAYEFRCPYGLVFDEQKLVCEWPWLVPACSDSGSTYTRTDYDHKNYGGGSSTQGVGGYYTGGLPNGYSGSTDAGYSGGSGGYSTGSFGSGVSGPAGVAYGDNKPGAFGRGQTESSGTKYSGGTAGSDGSGYAGGHGGTVGVDYSGSTAGGHGSSGTFGHAGSTTRGQVGYTGSGYSGSTGGGHDGSIAVDYSGSTAGGHGSSGTFGYAGSSTKEHGGYTGSGYSGSTTGGHDGSVAVDYSGSTAGGRGSSGTFGYAGSSTKEHGGYTGSGYSGSTTGGHDGSIAVDYSGSTAGGRGGSGTFGYAGSSTKEHGGYTGSGYSGSTTGGHDGSIAVDYSGSTAGGHGSSGTFGYAGSSTKEHGGYTGSGYSGSTTGGHDGSIAVDYSGSTAGGHGSSGTFGYAGSSTKEHGGYTGSGYSGSTGSSHGGSIGVDYSGSTAGGHGSSATFGYTGSSTKGEAGYTGSGYSGSTTSGHGGSIGVDYSGSTSSHDTSLYSGSTAGDHGGSISIDYSGSTSGHGGSVDYSGSTTGGHAGSIGVDYSAPTSVHGGSIYTGSTIGGHGSSGTFEYTVSTSGEHVGSPGYSGSTSGGHIGPLDYSGSHDGSIDYSGSTTGGKIGSIGAQYSGSTSDAHGGSLDYSGSTSSTHGGSINYSGTTGAGYSGSAGSSSSSFGQGYSGTSAATHSGSFNVDHSTGYSSSGRGYSGSSTGIHGGSSVSTSIDGGYSQSTNDEYTGKQDGSYGQKYPTTGPSGTYSGSKDGISVGFTSGGYSGGSQGTSGGTGYSQTTVYDHGSSEYSSSTGYHGGHGASSDGSSYTKSSGSVYTGSGGPAGSTGSSYSGFTGSVGTAVHLGSTGHGATDYSQTRYSGFSGSGSSGASPGYSIQSETKYPGATGASGGIGGGKYGSFSGTGSSGTSPGYSIQSETKYPGAGYSSTSQTRYSGSSTAGHGLGVDFTGGSTKDGYLVPDISAYPGGQKVEGGADYSDVTGSGVSITQGVSSVSGVQTGTGGVIQPGYGTVVTSKEQKPGVSFGVHGVPSVTYIPTSPQIGVSSASSSQGFATGTTYGTAHGVSTGSAFSLPSGGSTGFISNELSLPTGQSTYPGGPGLKDLYSGLDTGKSDLNITLISPTIADSGSVSYHGGFTSAGGSTGTIVSGHSIQGAIITDDSSSGTLITHGNLPGAVLTGSSEQGSVITGSGHPGFVKTTSGTPGYSISEGVKTVYTASISPGTFVQGSSAPGASVSATAAPGAILRGQSTPGVLLVGQTAPGVSHGAGITPGTVIGGSSGGYFTYQGSGESRDTGYKTTEYHDNGGRGTIRFNNGYVTSSTSRPGPTPGYTPSGFTKTGPTKTGITTASLGGRGGYVISTGKQYPTPNPEHIGERAFEGNVVGYTKTSTESSFDYRGSTRDSSSVDTSKIALGPSSPSSSSSSSTGYSYPKPNVQLGSTVATSAPIAATDDSLFVPVTTPTTILHGQVYNTPSLVGSAPITAAPAIVNTYSYDKPTAGRFDSDSTRVPSGFTHRRPTGAPVSFTTGAQENYKTTLFEAARLPVTVSSVHPVLDTGYQTVVSPTPIPVTVTDDRTAYQGGSYQSEFTFSQTDSHLYKGTDGREYVSTSGPTSGYSGSKSRRPFAPGVSTGTYEQSTMPSKGYLSPSTVPPAIGVTYAKPFSIPGVTYQSTPQPGVISASSQGYDYSETSSDSYSSQEYSKTTSNGSPTNLDIDRDQVHKLITNYDRGTARYTPSVYDTYTGTDSTGTTVSISDFPRKQSTYDHSSAKTSRPMSVATYSGGYSKSTSPSYEVTTQSSMTKGKVIVKWSDLHPLLLGKLGAECTCKSDPFANLRGPARKLIDSSKGRVDLANYDESEVYVDLEKEPYDEGDYVTSYEGSSQRPYKVMDAVTADRAADAIGYSARPSSTYLPGASTTHTPLGGSFALSGSSLGTNDVLEERSQSSGHRMGKNLRLTPAVNSITRHEVALGGSEQSSGYSAGVSTMIIKVNGSSGSLGGFSGAEGDLGLRGRSLGHRSGKNLGASSNSVGGQGASFDRFGPGGLRDLDETLEGANNCARPGLFRHPNFCNKFYACHWDEWKKKFTLHVFNCPIHLTFDNSAGACNWPSKGPACQGDNLLV